MFELKFKMRQLAAYYAIDVQYDIQDLDLIQNILAYNDIEVDVAVKSMMRNCSETIIR